VEGAGGGEPLQAHQHQKCKYFVSSGSEDANLKQFKIVIYNCPIWPQIFILAQF
jgi:hypothetical protein